MRRILENLWLTRIFGVEFDFSDVQSNYSRTYAWMANQLGHITLGMATVFSFSWIAYTISAFAGLFAGCDCWPGLAMEAETYAALTPIQIPMYYLNHILLVVVSLLLIGVAGALLVMGARAKHADVSAKEKTLYVPLSPVTSRVGNWIVLALIVLGVGVTIH